MRVNEVLEHGVGEGNCKLEVKAIVKSLDKNKVVLVWLLRGIEDFFFAFNIKDPFHRYRPFFYAMGFEMVCKAYLLATKASEYVGLNEKQAISKVSKLAKKMGHNVKKLCENIKKSVGDQKVNNLLSNEYDEFTGHEFLDVIEAVYLESRYFVPDPIHERFPVKGKKDMWWDPQFSSGLEEFCHAFSREILSSLKSDFGITIPKSDLSRTVAGEAGNRFCNVFFAGNMGDFVSG